MRKRTLAILAILIAIIGLVTGCTSSGKTNDQQKAVSIANNRQNYIPKNDVEGKNYNKRLQIADDPTTILWCTVYPQNPNVPAFTVPIVGKLTSSGKRPFPGTSTDTQTDGGYSTTEIPGADGMYGSSSEYRYGFRPDGTYVDFTGLETYCSTSPTLVQVQTTRIDLSSSDALAAASEQARAALKAGDPAKAQQILEAAMSKGAGK